MNISNPTTLRTEDYQSQSTWIGRLFSQLNPYFQSVVQVVNGNIDFNTNIASVNLTYNLTGFQKFSFNWPYTSPPVSFQIVQATKGTQKTSTIVQAAWSYDASKKSITVDDLIELSSSSGASALSGSYTLTIRVNV